MICFQDRTHKDRNGRVILCLAFLCLILMCAIGFGSVSTLAAGTAPVIEDTDIVLYEGNTYTLTYDDGYDAAEDGSSDDDVWYDWWYSDYAYFTSSDRSVATVDYYDGTITAMGKGTAVIYLNTSNGSASVNVKVKSNGAKISATELNMYKGQSENVRLTWSKKTITGYDYRVYSEDYYEAYGVEISQNNNGRFTLEADYAGTYYVYLILYADDKSFSRHLTVTVEETGLESNYLAVSIDSSVDLGLVNATLVSATVRDEDYYWWWSYEDMGKVSVSADGTITGVKEGTAYLDVTYRTAYGETRQETVNIYVTDPQYIPFDSALRAGEYYYPQFEDSQWCSNITIESSDPEIVRAGTDWNSDMILPLSYGTAELTITIDGRTFTDTVTVIDPQLSFSQCVMLKNKTKKLKVTGIPEGTAVTYTSSNKKIATVAADGTITSKKVGNCYITVDIDGFSLICTVNVGKNLAAKAVIQGIKVLGSSYSQERRMETGYYDCSSFAWRSYKAAGLALAGKTYAPTAADLAKLLESEGKAIFYEYTDAAQLLPGDLIFYTGYSNGRYKNIDHVAVYYGASYEEDYWYGQITNTGSIIHAVSAGVQTRSYSSYRTGDIVMICRPVK